MSLFQSVIVPAVLALLGGLSFIAYKHPEAYQKMVFPLAGVGMAVKFIATAWNSALARAHIEAIKVQMPPENLKELTAALQDKEIPFALLITCFFAYVGFLIVLSYLPAILKSASKN